MTDVLLIGAARSGTKWLRSVLASSQQIREIPFDVNFIWRTGQHDFPHDRLLPESCNAERAQKIRRKLHTSAKAGRDDVFLEKTVSNTLRVGFVHKVFPYGRYVHLLRDGRDVIESAWRQWNAKPELSYLFGKLKHFPLDDWRYGVWFVRNTFFKDSEKTPIWGPRYEGIEADVKTHGAFTAVCQQWVKSVEFASVDLALLPPEQVITVRYEELIHDTAKIRELVDFLKIEDGRDVVKFHASTVKSGLGGKWQKRLSAEQQDIMMEIAGPNLERLGYV